MVVWVVISYFNARYPMLAARKPLAKKTFPLLTLWNCLLSRIYKYLVRNRTFRIQRPGQNRLSTAKSQFWAKVLYRIWQLHIPVSPSCSNWYKHFHKANVDVFSYIIENGVCYLCICEKSYPRKLAFSYLEELAKEFNLSYGNEVDKPGLRPYAFVKFGKSAPSPSSNNE